MSLLRRKCVVCGRDDELLCSSCVDRLAPPPTTRIRGVGRVDALFAYDDVGASVVRALKFHNFRAVIATIADDLAAVVADRVGVPAAVTWLPTSASRRRSRGYDQAELLARSVARRLDTPAVALLRRRPGAPQTGLSWADRSGNVEFSLRRTPRRVSGPVAVFDDVCTTGATMRAGAETLEAAGAENVHWFALARTP